MGKADTHRDAHLKPFIPRGAYNTSVIGGIPVFAVRVKRRTGFASGMGKKGMEIEAESGTGQKSWHGLASLGSVVVGGYL